MKAGEALGALVLIAVFLLGFTLGALFVTIYGK